jgi:cyclic pyranopterin phosphate synthase
VVASVSAPFCGDCNHLRGTADGVAYSCLFAAPGSGLDLKPWLQEESGAAKLELAMASLWNQRSDRYSEERNTAKSANSAHAEMAYLGG